MCALLLVALAALAPVSAKDDQFTPLFDGKTLTGWTYIVKPDKDGKKADPKDTWSVVDGTIRCTGSCRRRCSFRSRSRSA